MFVFYLSFCWAAAISNNIIAIDICNVLERENSIPIDFTAEGSLRIQFSGICLHTLLLPLDAFCTSVSIGDVKQCH